MIIQEKIGNVFTYSLGNRRIEWLPIEWYEASKRIQRKRTQSGTEVMLKFMNENPDLNQGDILFESDSEIIAVDIIPTDCLVIKPRDIHEMAAVCYEIGNKHLPLFYEDGFLFVPFEATLSRLFTALGYDVKKENRKLSGAMKTTTAPHSHGGRSLFDTIMQLTQSNS